jgi:hypothetical protein
MIESFVKLKVHKITRRMKKTKECRRGNPTILVKWRRQRRGPHRKVLGRVSGMLSRDRRMRSSNSTNGLLIVHNFSRREIVTVRLIELTR